MASAAGGSSEEEDETESKREQMEDLEDDDYKRYEDEDVLGNQEIFTSSDSEYSLTKYLALVFLRLACETEEFCMVRNLENIGMFNDIVYRCKHQDSSSYSTYFIKFVSTEHYVLNLFEAYLSYNAVKRYKELKDKHKHFLNVNDFQSFALVIANKFTLENFHLRAYFDEDTENSLGLMSFNAKFVNILINDTDTLKTYRMSLCYALQSLVSDEVEVTTFVLNDLKMKLKTEHLKEILSPEYYKDNEQFIIILENIIAALEGEIDWRNFSLSFKIYALEQMCANTLITLLRQQVWNMYDFPIMITDTIITKLLGIFRKWCTDHDHCHYIWHTDLKFWYHIIREHSHDAFSAVRNRHISVLRNVRYKKKIIDILKSVIHKHQVIHVVPPVGKCNKLTLWKIVQSLDKTSHFFMDDEVLQFHWREASHLWLASDIAILIPVGDFWDVQRIFQFLKSICTKKLVVVSKDCQQTKILAHHLHYTYTRFEDNLNVDQLIECLCFNSRSFKLNGVPMYKALQTKKEIRAMAAQETFEELLNYGKLKAFCNEVDNVSYTVFRHHFIHREVIFEKGHIFGIKGDVKQLKCLKPFQKKSFEGGISKTLPCKEVKNRKDFMTLCEKHNNAHWLQLKDNQLIWLESKGSMEVIRKHIINTAPAFYSFDNAYCFKNEPPGHIILIVDDCDTGLFNCIINCKTKLIPKYFILSMKLLDCVPLLENPNITFEELIENSTSTYLHKEFFKFALEKTERAEVFLNAFGCLEPVHHKKMVEFINKLLQNTMVRKVWITADRKHKEMLEVSFSTLAFTRIEGQLEKFKELKIAGITTENESKILKKHEGNKQLVEVKYSERDCKASLLHVACQFGDLHQAKYLILQENADIDATDSIFLQTPLMWAARSGKEEIVDFLIQKGARTALYDKKGTSAIHLAAISGDIGTVRSLTCAAGMDINTVDDLKRTPLMWAVMHSDLNMVKYLIKNGASPLCKDEYNYNLLQLAIESGNLPVIDFLLLRKETQAFINSHNSKRETPLILAAQNNFITVALMLLKRGAKVELQDRCGQTPLHVALRQNNTKMFKMLLKWSSDHCVATADSQGKTILHLAAKHGNIEALNCLEKYQCDESICNMPSKVWLNSALHYAAKEGHLEVTKWLIKHGSKVNALDRKHYTPLHWANVNGQSKIVQVLIDNGANVNQCNRIFQTPAHIAAMKGHADIVFKLWLYGADMNAIDYKNYTPFLRAQQNKCQSVLFLLK